MRSSVTPRPHGFIRVGLLLGLCAVLVHPATAQDSSDLPACGQTCISNEIALAPSLGCPGGENTCLCQSSSFGDGIRDCAQQTCTSTADIDATIAYANSYCDSILSGSSLIASSATSSSASSSSSLVTTTSSSNTRTAAASSPSSTSSAGTTYSTYTSPVTITFTSTGSLITATYQTTSYVTDLAQYRSLESSQTNTMATSPSSDQGTTTSSSSSSSSGSAAAATDAAAAANSNGSGGLSTSAKIGIGVGVGVVATGVVIGLIFFFIIMRRSNRMPSSGDESDASSKGKEKEFATNGRADSFNYKTGYDPTARLGPSVGGGVGAAGAGAVGAGAAGAGGAYAYNYSSGYDRGGLQQQDYTPRSDAPRTGEGGDVRGQSGAIGLAGQRHEMTGARGQTSYRPGEPTRPSRASAQSPRLDVNLGEKW